MSSIRWGVMSTAKIGATVVDACAGSEWTEFVAVASRDEDKARSFASEHGLQQSFGSYDAMLASDEIDAVYVALPVALHTEWTVRALQAGKHVLCEKPFATSAADAARCFAAAEQAGRLCVEGLMYRHHPQTVLARQLVSDGVIGGLAMIRAALTVAVEPGDIRRNAALGGGSYLDLGCYCVSALRLFGGEPDRVCAERVDDSGPDPADLRMSATLRFAGNVLGQFDVGLDLPRRDELELIGTRGKIVLPDPWICREARVDLWRDGAWEHLPAPLPDGRGDADGVYRLEFERVSAAIAGDRPLPFGVDDAVNQARVLEALDNSSRQKQTAAQSRPSPPGLLDQA